MRRALNFALIVCVVFLLSVQLGVAAEKQAQATINIYRDRLDDIKPELFGQSVVGTSIYASHAGGAWDPNADACADGIVGCWNEEVLAAAKDGGYLLLGFPGGKQSRSYDWTKGLEYNGSSKEYPFGILEFLVFAREIGANAIIGVSMYDPETGEFASASAIEKARALVEFCNGTSGYWAELRTELGYPEPFGVKYWTIDDYPWEDVSDPLNPSILLQNIAPAQYAENFIAFSEAMKSVDSSILIGAPSYVIFDINHFESLLRTFPEVAPDDTSLWPDFFFDVFFRPDLNRDFCYVGPFDACSQTAEALQFLEDNVLPATLAAPTLFVKNFYEPAKTLLYSLWADYPDKLQNTFFALTNYHAGLTFRETCSETNPAPCPVFKYNHSLGAALFSADLLMKLIQASTDKMLLAQHWNLVDKADELDSTSAAYYPAYFGALKVLLNSESGWDSPTIVRRPDQLVFELFAKNRGQKIAKTSITSNTFDSPNLPGIKLPSIEGIELNEDEAFLRIRILRKNEYINGDYFCRVNDVENPDPGSYITGSFMLDNFYLASEDNPMQNLVTNGGFEDGLSGWTYTPHSTVVTEIASGKSKQNHYLKLTFSGDNPYYSNLSQTIQVQPDKRYFLRYWFRTEELSVKTRNLMCDGSFDHYTALPNEWWKLDAGSGVTAQIITSSNCFSPPNCLRLCFPVGYNGEFFHVYQQKPYNPSTDPQTYIFSARMKAEGIRSRARFEFLARKADDTPFNWRQPVGIFGTTDWLDVRTFATLYSPSETASIGVRMRRQPGAPETGGCAYYDDVRLYRDPQNYTPRIAIDFCRYDDENCSAPTRTIYDAPRVMGTTDWQVREISGLPYLSAITLADDPNNLKLFVVNRSPDTSVKASIALYTVGKQGDDSDGADDDTDDDTSDDDDQFEGWIIKHQVLSGINGLTSTNEDYDPNAPGSAPEVEYTEPEEYLRTTSSKFDYTFEPASLTVLTISYNAPGGDDDDDTTDDDVGDDDSGGGGKSGLCGCGCSL